MSKLSLMLVSLVAAVPGLFLSYLLVMSFLNHGEVSSSGFKTLAGAGLAFSALMVLMPGGILIFGPRAPKKSDEPADGKASAAEGDEDEDFSSSGDDIDSEELVVAEEESDGDVAAEDDFDEPLEDFGEDSAGEDSAGEDSAVDDMAADEEGEYVAESSGADEEDFDKYLMGEDSGETDAVSDEEEVEFEFEAEEEEPPPEKGKRKKK